jgi:hypothetical protein
VYGSSVCEHKNANQNYTIKFANITFKDVAEFRYLGTIINQSYRRELRRD